MQRKKGKFVVMEGIGGCGKGTMVEMTEKWLKSLGYKVLTTCEHTRDTSLGQLVEDIIKGRSPKIDLVALQLLYVADRANHTAKVIVPALDEYDFVIGDRYEASTISYAPKNMREFFMQVNKGIAIRPDLTMVIDLEPEVAVSRVKSRHDADIFDNIKKLKRCRQNYKWYCQNAEGKCAWIDGSGTKEEVLVRVQKRIEKYFF